jgi:hypothetical protein
MEITEEQYARIKDSLPVQRGNVSLTNLQGTERDSVCGRAGLQVARASEALRPLAHDLYAHEPVGEKRRIGPRV